MAFAAGTPLDGAGLRWPWALPFIGLLLTIATGPLLFPRIWHHHYGKFAFVWSVLTVAPLAAIYGTPTAFAAFLHAMLANYMSFIALLFALYVVAFPVYDQVDADFVHDYPQQQLRRIAGELGIPMLDLLPPLRAALAHWKAEGHDPAQRLFYDWCHHTPAGSELIAREVHAFLQQQMAVD